MQARKEDPRWVGWRYFLSVTFEALPRKAVPWHTVNRLNELMTDIGYIGRRQLHPDEALEEGEDCGFRLFYVLTTDQFVDFILRADNSIRIVSNVYNFQFDAVIEEPSEFVQEQFDAAIDQLLSR